MHDQAHHTLYSCAYLEELASLCFKLFGKAREYFISVFPLGLK